MSNLDRSLENELQDLSEFPFYPLNDYVLLLPVEVEQKTTSGLFTPEGYDETPFRRGIVIKTGPGEWRKKGKQVDVDVEPLDVVLYPQYAVFDLELGGSHCSVIAEKDILMVVDQIEI